MDLKNLHILTKIWKWLFGMALEYEEILSEDDCLRSVARWTVMLFSNKRQRIIFMTAIFLMSIHQMAFIIYVFFWKPELHKIVPMLPSEMVVSSVQLLLICMLYVEPLYPEWFEHLNIALEYSKTCSEELESRIEHESSFKKFHIHIIIIVGIINYFLYAWRGGDSKHFFSLFVMEILWKGVLNEILFCVVFNYTIFSTAVVFSSNTYACSHIYFQLLILEENLEKLNCKHTENENYQLHNNLYQRKIRRELMSCWKHYLIIRRLKFVANKIAYWAIYSQCINCILTLGTICIYFLLDGHPSENPGMVFTGFITLAFLVVSSESGQLLKSESQNLHNTLLRTQWYQWNRENRKFLLMFLVATETPLQITSFNIDQSRELYAKVFKGLYSVLTCINSLRT